MSMKFYVHFEEEKSPFTMVLRFEKESLTLKEVNEAVQKCLKSKEHKCPPNCEVHLYKGIFRSSRIDSDAQVKTIKPNEDIFAKFVPYVKNKDKPKMPSEKKMEQAKHILEYKGTMDAKLMPDGKTQFNPKTVKDWLILGEKWRVLGQPRKTLEIMLGLIQVKCGIPEMYEEIVKIYLEAGRPAIASEYIKKGLDEFPGYTRLKLRQADCYMAQNEPDKAIDVLLEYTRELRKQENATMEQRHEVQLTLCRAYQMKNQRDMAIVIIHGVVKELQEQDGENTPAVIEYARLTFDLSPKQASEAATIIVSALVGDKDNKFRQKALAEMCQRPGGMEQLRKAMKTAADDPEALAFFANIIKAHGAMKEALEMFEQAISHKTKVAKVILSYVHMQELVQEFHKAFKCLVKFFQDEPSLGLASVKNKHIFQCIEQAKDSDIYLYGYPSESDNEGVKEIQELIEKLSIKEITKEYGEEEQNRLAVWFTLVKILYLRGAMGLLPNLIKLLDPLHKNKGNNLHLTIIRNEAAYYGCITKLVKTWVDYPLEPVTSSAQENFLYFLGDSHCLTPAWRTINFRDKPHVIHPFLSTGTKIWHLRPQSVYYPKVNFENAVKQIPYRAPVIMLFGEIDCREGLLVCCEKCKYDTMEQGIEVIQNIYVKLLEELYQKYKWTIYVHPVPPVLDVTRSIVNLFNSMLEKRLQSEPNLHWLNFIDDIMETSDGKTTLKTEYELDKTHLHPCYVSVLETALNKVQVTSDDAWTVD